MSFSSEVKEELSLLDTPARHCQLAELAAIIGMCGDVCISAAERFRLRIHTENAAVSRKCFTLLRKTCGKNYPEKIAAIVSGVAEGCVQSDCALIGGETAEHPGLMPENDYDLAGFAVGVVDKKDLITGETIKAGDTLIGIASTGVHSNGFSLVRKVFQMDKETLDTYHEELGKTLGEALLAPTRIYVKALRSVKEAGVTIKGCSHITGGGFYENIPRMLPDGVKAVVKKDSYEVPAIFKMLAKEGTIEEHMMYNTFNMGIGMVLAVDPADVDKTIEALAKTGDQAWVIGEIADGEKGVELC